MGNDGLKVRIAPRSGGGDTHRFFHASRRACPFKGGLSAAVLPPPQLRTPMFARQSRRFTTQNRASGRFEGPKFWRFAREGRFDNTPTGLCNFLADPASSSRPRVRIDDISGKCPPMLTNSCDFFCDYKVELYGKTTGGSIRNRPTFVLVRK